MSNSQETLMREMLSKTQRMRKEMSRLKEKISQEASMLVEKKTLDMKNLKRDLESQYTDLE